MVFFILTLSLSTLPFYNLDNNKFIRIGAIFSLSKNPNIKTITFL